MSGHISKGWLSRHVVLAGNLIFSRKVEKQEEAGGVDIMSSGRRVKGMMNRNQNVISSSSPHEWKPTAFPAYLLSSRSHPSSPFLTRSMLQERLTSDDSARQQQGDSSTQWVRWWGLISSVYVCVLQCLFLNIIINSAVRTRLPVCQSTSLCALICLSGCSDKHSL